MWKVEANIYYKSTSDSILTRKYFNSKDAALDYINSHLVNILMLI